MGNASASQKGRSSNAPRAAKDLSIHDLLPALRERFEELSGLPAAAAAVAAEGEKEERYVMFDDWSELPGPRGKQLAKRLYSVLDADGDGKLDFEEFASAARLLKGSPDEEKLTLLFKMYGDGDCSKGGSFSVGREGLKAFILDIVAASPPLQAPPDHDIAVIGGCGGVNGATSSLRSWATSSASAVQVQQTEKEKEKGRASVPATAGAGPQPNLERELEGVLAKMAGVVLNEYDADNDGLLTEKEWRAYLKREEESVSAYLQTLSDNVETLLLP